ncbi:hypothetical protein GBAR_LOCUS24543 [Geodia barretti]|uniref:Uncharacterized protein n=1 Tax=Geodia barretti TaxID=519541 RepID=A0AA35TA29_GEOBA|nr:hypothetical protein GBAR_LOCUS24543 [Geodia barretti]
MEYFDPTGDILMVVASTQVGSNNRKRDLTVELIDKCGPSLVVGRMADIYTLGQIVVERAVSSGSDEEEEEEEEERDSHHPQISIEHSPPTATARKASAPAILHSRIMQKIQHGGPARRHTDLSPCISPQTSPRHSAMGMSPSTSPRASPSGVRRGLRQQGRKIGRTPTLHPRITMKGQFQDFSLLEVNVDDAIQYGHRLAAHSRASVFFMETSLLTDGETDIEILNSQSGTKYLHSLLPCSAAVAAACVSSVLRETDDSEDALLHQFSHALSLWCVAVEEAGSHANQHGTLLPGTMRQSLIDALHYLTESHVRSAANLSLYCMRTGRPSQGTPPILDST